MLEREDILRQNRNMRQAERKWLEPEDEPQGYYDVTVTVTKTYQFTIEGYYSEIEEKAIMLVDENEDDCDDVLYGVEIEPHDEGSDY